MIVLKCKMCGANITPESGKTYATCEYCGSVMTLPNITNDRIANLFNRATHYRQQHEFDKAQATYENILMEDDGNAEAYWGVVLSVFGIDYVEDPRTKKRIPTCNRVQRTSILKDLNYQKAIEYAADESSRKLYEQEAKEIERIQEGILAISDKEDTYDIFICYKETDNQGKRTLDSVLAQEIYYQLEKEGYKVFFSRLTLEDKAGTEYEPYIFAALNSASVMLVIGTRAEHFNAVWVKNEWSRFLALAENRYDKVLIPCYREMNAYELPEELAVLQAQDMGKIGFLQDLLHGLKKIFSGNKNRKEKTGYKPRESTKHTKPKATPEEIALKREYNKILTETTIRGAKLKEVKTAFKIGGVLSALGIIGFSFAYSESPDIDIFFYFTWAFIALLALHSVLFFTRYGKTKRRYWEYEEQREEMLSVLKEKGIEP